LFQEWTSKIPDDLIASFTDAVPPVIFIGSGFGKEAVPPLKTGAELASELRTTLGIDDGGEGLAELLQYYQKDMAGNRQAVANWLSKQLLAGRSKPGGAHRLLLELPCKEFLTTNYDSLLADASHEISGHYLTAIDDPKSYENQRDKLYTDGGRPILGRLHGAFENQTRMVATTDDYIKSYTEEQQWSEVLRSILANNRVIFIGYSMRDFTTWTSYISMYVRWNGNQYPHVMVAPSSSHHVSNFWDHYGVKYVPLTAAKFLIAIHSGMNSLETKETVLYAAAAACMGRSYDDALEELEQLKARHKYPDLKLTAMKVVLEEANASV
jgi:hypothetical protein